MAISLKNTINFEQKSMNFEQYWEKRWDFCFGTRWLKSLVKPFAKAAFEDCLAVNLKERIQQEFPHNDIKQLICLYKFIDSIPLISGKDLEVDDMRKSLVKAIIQLSGNDTFIDNTSTDFIIAVSSLSNLTEDLK